MALRPVSTLCDNAGTPSKPMERPPMLRCSAHSHDAAGSSVIYARFRRLRMERPRTALLLAAVASVVVLAVGEMALAPAAGDSHPTPPQGAVPGMIAVADYGNDRIQVFYPNGTFAFKFGSDESSYSVGAFRGLKDVAVAPDGRIFVTDRSRQDVRVFHPDGSFSHALGSGGGALGQFYGPTFVAVGPNGQIVVSESGLYDHGRIQVFSPNGEVRARG